MKRALVTGITGQDGSYLAELLLAKGYEVFGIVRGSPTAHYENLEAVRDDLTLMQGDLLDQMTLLEAINRAEPDELYNLAATSFVPASWHQPVMSARRAAITPPWRGARGSSRSFARGPREAASAPRSPSTRAPG